MSRVRADLTAAEVAELQQTLERRVESIGLATQPKLAARLVELSQDPDAQIAQYSEAIRTDWTLTGRLLRLANSAFYSQRSPVTKLDRALVVIGLERTKAISLGFYLSRATAGSPNQDFCKMVWGQSVYRAGLCAALARAVCPALAAEAFIVGLMLDCGQPLMPRLVGDQYLAMHAEHDSPVKLFSAEQSSLPFTHADVSGALVRKWKLPELLARPIAWHHSLPSAGKTGDGPAMLQRLAYYVGAVQLSRSGTPVQSAPLPSIAQRLFEIDGATLQTTISKATAEYRSTIGLFEDVASAIGSIDEIADAVQMQLIEMMDAQMSRSLLAETRGGPQHVVVGGQEIEIEPGDGGSVVAFIKGANGDRLMSCMLNPCVDNADSLRLRLGLDDLAPHEVDELMSAMRAMAA